MYLINGFGRASPSFGSDQPTGSGQVQGLLHFKWYQSLGLGGSTNDFEIFVKCFLKLFIACIVFPYKG